MLEVVNCEKCQKVPELCVCPEIKQLSNRTHVLILQHPQEPDKTLGTAKLTNLSLKNSTLRVGLSWPNLATALYGKGTAVPQHFNATRWGILFLGSGMAELKKALPLSREPRIVAVTKKGLPDPEKDPAAASLDGIIVLDGTWSQAKTLWWRNAWMLKLRRLVLLPKAASLYGKHRREPKRECLSTLESVGLSLRLIEKNPQLETELNKVLSALMTRFEAMPKPEKKQDNRGRNRRGRGGRPRGDRTQNRAQNKPQNTSETPS